MRVCSFLYLCLHGSGLPCICLPVSFPFVREKKEKADLPNCRFKAFVATWEHCYLSCLGDSDTALGVREQCTFPPCNLHPISVASDFWLFVQVGIFSCFHSSSLLNISHPFCLGSFLDLSCHHFLGLSTWVPLGLYPIWVLRFYSLALQVLPLPLLSFHLHPWFLLPV